MFLIFKSTCNQARLDYTVSVLNNRLYNVCSFFNTRNLTIEYITCFFVSLFSILIQTLCKVSSVILCLCICTSHKSLSWCNLKHIKIWVVCDQCMHPPTVWRPLDGSSRAGKPPGKLLRKSKIPSSFSRRIHTVDVHYIISARAEWLFWLFDFGSTIYSPRSFSEKNIQSGNFHCTTQNTERAHTHRDW